MLAPMPIVLPHACPETASGATFDESGIYRYLLWRVWDWCLPRVGFILLNPSTADERYDDQTIRRCMGFARSWGYGGIEVANLFALRATSPRLLRSAADPVGPENDAHIAALVSRVPAVVVGWGNGGLLRGRGEDVLSRLRGTAELGCLGVTKLGQPRHPLYQPASCVPLPLSRDHWGRSSECVVGFSAMSDSDDGDGHSRIVDFVDDAIVAYANSPRRGARQLPASGRARVVGKLRRVRSQPPQEFWR
jgi:hypothetical protein